MILFRHTVFFIGVIFVIPIFIHSCFSSKSTLSNFKAIEEPKDNLSTLEKIELGRELFFDKRLSINDSIACASCHIPEFAFSDRKKVSDGVYGRKTERNSPSILNAGYLPTVMFDGHLETLEKQVIVPIQEHVEMDMNMLDLIKKLRAIQKYQSAAQFIFKRDFDPFVLTRSIAAYERSLISKNSRFDQYFYQGNKKAMSKDELKGWQLFSEKLYCIQCHPAPYFTTYKVENNGLYKDYSAINDKGKFRIENDSSFIGFFKIPSLRNIELTYPYMHDGSITTLEDVIQHYQKGASGNKTQSKIIQKFNLSLKEKNQLLLFLKTLTDTSFD
ncbi:MAG: cytochrome-c peroxidase [Flavobacteriia bacterium]|nr:cytochrome-c peroxidase [Flavobacteriia bacterium]